MKILDEQIRKRILSIWPHMKNTLRLYDEFYTHPTFEQAKIAISKCPRHRKIPYSDYVSDCDKKSKWLDADIKEYCAITLNLNYTWTFGVISGLIWNSEIRKHTGNIFLTEDKIYLVDSTNFDEIWEANSKKDLMIEAGL